MEKDIKKLFTRSYSPQANGVCERTNKEVRKIIHIFWIRQENTVWYDILPQVEANKNATYNSTVKGSPVSIYENTRKEIKLNVA
jgi:transposase InsO family protein